MYFRYRKLEIICTNNTVYTRVWPSIGASYNHLLHDEYNSIQCISGVQVRNNITTSELLQRSSLSLRDNGGGDTKLLRKFSSVKKRSLDML